MMIERDNWFIEFIEEYSQFLRDDNWFTYHVAHIEFENDAIMGGYEATFVILGLGIRWRWNHTETDRVKEIHRRMEEIKAGTAKATPLSSLQDRMQSGDH